MHDRDIIMDAIKAAMASGNPREHMKPPADLQAQLAAAVEKHRPRHFEIGALVYPEPNSEWRRVPGLPSVVLDIRPDAPPDYTAKALTERGIGYDLRVGFWTPIIGVTPIWVRSSDFVPYDEALHGAGSKPAADQQAA